MAFPISESQLVAMFMEAITYGIYVVTFFLCMRALLNGRDGERKHYNWPMIFVVLGMFVLATLDVALTLRRALEAFVFYQGPGGATMYYERISLWSNVVQTGDVQLMTLLGDGMLMYRCLLIYAYRWWILIAPALLWCGDVVVFGLIMHLMITSHKNELLTAQAFVPLFTSYIAITFALNLVVTGLIVWRIWTVNRANSCLNHIDGHRPGRSRLDHVIRIIIESGLLYTTTVLAGFISDLVGTTAIYCVGRVLIIIVGVSFNLIIVRVNEGTAVGGSSYGENVPLTGPLVFTTRPAMSVGIGVMIATEMDNRDVEDNTISDTSPSDENKSHWEVAQV